MVRFRVTQLWLHIGSGEGDVDGVVPCSGPWWSYVRFVQSRSSCTERFGDQQYVLHTSHHGVAMHGSSMRRRRTVPDRPLHLPLRELQWEIRDSAATHCITIIPLYGDPGQCGVRFHCITIRDSAAYLRHPLVRSERIS